jgi:CheY-like chemotaxis protein
MPLIDLATRADHTTIEKINFPEAGSKPSCRRILLIDDEPLLLASVRRILAEHDVTCAGSARQALTLLESSPAFDIIFSDVMMPTMTGLELYEELRLHRPEDASRLVFLTGGSNTALGDDRLGSLPNRHLAKPFGVQDLRRTIREVLEQHETSASGVCHRSES